MGPLTKEIMIAALTQLNEKLSRARPSELISMIMGGGGAMILAHGFPKGTMDIDAIPRGMNPDALTSFVQEIATEMNLPHDWLNPYFSTFSHVLSPDYSVRLIEVYKSSHLKVDALGKEEMLTMKCFAHRTKDIPHARALIKKNVDLSLVEARLDELLKKRIPGTQEAIDFLQEILDE